MASKSITTLGDVLLNPGGSTIAVLRSPHELLEYYDVVMVRGDPALVLTRRDDVAVLLAEARGFEHRGIENGSYVLAASGDEDQILKEVRQALASGAPVAA